MQSCDICSRSKTPHYLFYSLLQPLPILKHLWSFDFIDFIIDLFILNSYDFIFGIVDCLINMVHFVLYTKSIANEKIAKYFIDIIYCYHRLSKDIILNRRKQLVSWFLKILLKILKMDIKLSLAFHLQTNRQMNAIIV